MGITLDGLSSGLDTTTLIASLMKVEAIPQTLLKNKVSDTQVMASALQALNTKIAALAVLAKTAAKPAAFDVYAATSSSDKVTAVSTAGASAGQIDFVVDRLSQTQVSVTGALTVWPDSGLTLTAKDGTATTITAASNSLDDVVKAINAAPAGVTAMKVASGTDSGGNPQYRLQLTAASAGAAAQFSISGTTAAVIDIKTAQDAQVTLWAGTAAAQAVTSATNTFPELLPGGAVTLASGALGPATVTVARDDKQAAKMASDLVTALNGVFSLIAARSAVSTSTDASGKTVTATGPFTGDSTVRDVSQKVLSAASLPVNGHSPSEFGVGITRDGNLLFDADKLTAALAKDPTGTKAALAEIASRVGTAAAVASDKYSGTITSQITGQQSAIKDLSDQISSWDLRLASRQAGLQSTYAALEVALGKMKSQQSWLTAQLSGLSSSSTGA
ncbi:flagellar filament capping protein FliD [Arthrobacter sp. A5]|uniref:flagellar filament capping protein FliD n=1 Tax=Arthrobacter sp. A5 TaxID=576926 RepID=UPI003DA83514